MKFQMAAILGLVLCTGKLYSQYSTDWIRPADNFQKTGVMIARDKLDNVVVTGYITANNIYSRKYDKFGNLQWENSSSSGVASNYEKSVWANCDSSNNIIITGYRYTIGTYHYPNALVVLKYDPAGNLLWKNTIPMTFFVNHITAFNMRSEIDNAGNIYIGTVATAPAGFVLVKLDDAGNILFTQNDNSQPVSEFLSMRLQGTNVLMSGGVPVTSNANAICWSTTGSVLWNTILNGRAGVDIEMDETGNSYLLTSLDNQVSPASQSDIVLYKLNSSGVQTAVNNFDFGGQDFPTRFIYSGGRISTIGSSSVSSGYFDWITLQVNTGLSKLWEARYNETTVNDEYPYGLTAKSNGEVFVTGRGGPNHTILGSNYLRMVTLKYDNTGIRKWVDSVNVFNGWGRNISLAADNSLYVVSDGYTTAFHFLDHDGSSPAPVPATVNVINVGNTSATFTWSSVPGAYLYHIRYKKTADAAWTVNSTNATSFAVTGLAQNTSYDYGTEAINSGGPSGYSVTQSFVTGSVLPVTGLELSARREGSRVLLNWSTQTEINTSHFEVQRSRDGVQFNTIGTVISTGNSITTMYYQFTDAAVPSERYFYRLKLVDRDDQFKLSPVRVVYGPGLENKIYLYPNPAKNRVTVILAEISQPSSLVKIYNQVGQSVRVIRPVAGSQFIEIDISDMKKGLYFIQLESGNRLISREKLMVQ